MNKNNLRTWQASLRRLWLDRSSVFATHCVYSVLGFVLFAPLLSLVGWLLLKLADEPAISDQDIAWFLLSLPGMLALILFATLLVTILGFELATLMTLGAGTLHGRRLGTLDALRFTAAKARHILSFALRLVIRMLLLTLPFLVAAAIAWSLLSEFDINYYLSEQPPNFWIAVVVIGLLLLVMLALLTHKLVGWSLALPLVIFAEVSPARSFVESNVITRGKRREIFYVLGVWGLLAFLLGLLVLGIVQQLGAWTVPAFYGSIKLLVPVLGGFVALWVVGNFLVTVFTSGSFAYVLVSLYDNYGPDISKSDLQGLQQRESSQGWRLTAGQLGVALPVGAVVAALMGYWLLQGMQVQDEAIVIAHRGAAGAAPENTLASIRRANEDGTDWVEIDVQETADGEVVVIHDSDFMKLAGNPLKVWEGTLAQVQDIDIGSWFAPEYSGERVPTLREVLNEVSGKSHLVIELKYYGHDQQLEQRVVDIVEQAGMVDNVAIMSLKYEGIQKIRKLRPDWTIGLLAVKALGNLTRLDVDFLAVNTGMATAGFVRRAQDSGKQVWVWTINDAVTMSRVMSLGVNGIITDEPALAREVIEQRAELGSAERLLVHTAVLFGRPVPVRDYRDESP